MLFDVTGTQVAGHETRALLDRCQSSHALLSEQEVRIQTMNDVISQDLDHNKKNFKLKSLVSR